MFRCSPCTWSVDHAGDTEFEALFYVSAFDFGHLNMLNIPKYCFGEDTN